MSVKTNGLRSVQERASELYTPTERNASPEALICLKCNLPARECDKMKCKRYEEKMRKLKGGNK